jgi:hypothetical protein
MHEVHGGFLRANVTHAFNGVTGIDAIILGGAHAMR